MKKPAVRLSPRRPASAGERRQRHGRRQRRPGPARARTPGSARRSRTRRSLGPRRDDLSPVSAPLAGRLQRPAPVHAAYSARRAWRGSRVASNTPSERKGALGDDALPPRGRGRAMASPLDRRPHPGRDGQRPRRRPIPPSGRLPQGARRHQPAEFRWSGPAAAQRRAPGTANRRRRPRRRAPGNASTGRTPPGSARRAPPPPACGAPSWTFGMQGHRVRRSSTVRALGPARCTPRKCGGGSVRPVHCGGRLGVFDRFPGVRDGP